jgi:hypothetical protein
MGDKILVCVFIIIGSGFIAYAVLGRIFGFHRPIPYRSGGHASLAGELTIGIFVLCCGLTAAFDSPVWLIPALAAFAVGFVSQTRAQRQYIAKNKKLREENAVKYTGVFDNPPPESIENIKEDELDLYDAGSCTYLGRVSKNDVKVLIERFKEIPEQGPNDIYMLVESIEMLPKCSVSPEFISLLKKAFGKRDYLEIRWLPPAKSTKTSK